MPVSTNWGHTAWGRARRSGSAGQEREQPQQAGTGGGASSVWRPAAAGRGPSFLASLFARLAGSDVAGCLPHPLARSLLRRS
jgi:hypothetical protein